MPHERFFVDSPLTEGEQVHLVDTEFHHLYHVMRAREGDQLELVNGKNQLAIATVLEMQKKSALLGVDSVTEPPLTKPILILAQAIPRFNRLEYIVEKGTELDVSQFWLFPGLLSEKKAFSPHQPQRMEQIMKSALKQCGRLDLPSIRLLPPLLAWEKPQGTVFYGG